MKVDQSVIQIIGEHECPYYKVDDEFKVCGHAVFIPCEKPACMMLLDDIRRILPRINEQNPKLSFYCSGCTGLIKMDLELKPNDPSPCSNVKHPESDAILELMRHLPIFHSVKVETLKYLIPFFKQYSYQKGDILIRKGQRATNLFILVSGKVAIMDDHVTIATLGKGELFGEMSLISGNPANATVKAAESGSYLSIDGKYFRRIFHRFPQFQMYLVRMLAKKLAKSNRDRIDEYITVFSGNLSEIRPSELFQALNLNQKTGELLLQLSKGNATIYFREGEIIAAEYDSLEGCDAFFEIMKEHTGRFNFSPELPEDKKNLDSLGDMMRLLITASQQIDQDLD